MVHKNALFNILGTLSSTLFIGLGIIVVSRVLGPSKMGQYSYALWMINTTVLIATAGVPLSLTKFIPEVNKKLGKEGIRELTLKLIMFTAALSVVAALFIAFVFPVIHHAQGYVDYLWLVAIAIPFSAIFLVLNAYLRGIEKFNVVASVGTFTAIISSLFIIIPAIVFKNVNSVLIGYDLYLIFSLIVIILSSPSLFKKGRSSGKNNLEIKEVIKYIVSVSIIILLDTIVWDKSEVFFLKRFTQDQQVAFYSIDYTVVTKIASLIPSALTAVLIPAYSSLLSASSKAKRDKLFFNSTRYLSLFIIPVAIGGAALASPIITYLLGKAYIGGIGTLRVMFIFCGFAIVASSASTILYGMKRQNIIILIGIVLSIINILLDFVIIPRYASIGAAFTNGIVQMVGAIWTIGYTLKRLDLKFPYLDILKSMVASIVMGIFLYASVTFIPYLLVNCISVVFAGVLYLFALFAMGTFNEDDKKLVANLNKLVPMNIRRFYASENI